MNIRKKMKNGQIYNELSKIYLTSMLIPIIVLALIFSMYFYQLIRKEDMETSRNVLNTIELNISSCFSQMSRCSLAWITNDDILNFYKKVNNNHGHIPQEPVDLTKKYEISCDKTLSLLGTEIRGMGFLPAQNEGKTFYYHKKYKGNLITTTPYTDLNRNKNYSVTDNLARIIYYPPHFADYANDEEQMIFSIGRKIRDVDTKQEIGIVTVDVSASFLFACFHEIKVGENSGYMILDNQKQVVYSTNPELNGLSAYWEPGIEFMKVPRKGSFDVCSVSISNSPWTLIYFGASKDVLSRTNVIFYVTPLLGILTLLCSFVLFQINSIRFAKPVKDILQVIKENENGNFTAHIPIESDTEDEFTLISRQYNHMIDMLNLYIEREYKAQLEQQKAEFYTLQMQINPHFLYNIMNGILALNRIGEQKLLEKTIIQLTQLFRYTCSNQHTVKLSEEMEFVRQYLFLQEMRFSDRLIYTIDCCDEIKDVMVPKLIIQPLVENSIVHGLEPVDRMVHLEIKAETAEKNGKKIVRIIVSDDGCGSAFKDDDRESHIGLDNLQKRIHALLPEGTFWFESTPGNGAISVIEFLLKVQ